GAPARNCLNAFGPTAAGRYPHADLRKKTCPAASPAPGAETGPRKSAASENPHALPAREAAGAAGRFCSIRAFARRQAAWEPGRPERRGTIGDFGPRASQSDDL